ncbi:MAG: outer membrane beta-barrel protein [Thiohalomonadales bacterium]
MKFNQLGKLVILLGGFIALIPATVSAGTDSGFYVGGGIGDTSIEAKNTTPNAANWNIDGGGSAYKLFGGFNFGIIPLIDIAVEGSYVDFGDASGNITGGGSAKVDVTGYDAFGLVGLSFGPFGIFAKAGVIDWSVDKTISGVGSSDSGSDGAYGVGVRFAFAKFSIRAEYEAFDVGALEALTLSTVSLLYTF